jgi:hypothetical protein
VSTQKVDEVIQQAKTFLKQNTPPQEEEYFVTHKGDLVKLPEGTYYDYERDCVRFKK